jgi:hypothetical protein
MRIQNEPIFAILLAGGALIHIVLLIVVIEVVFRLVTGRGAGRGPRQQLRAEAA